MPVCRLNRAVISLKGDDVQGFLSGLITNSLNDDLTFAALLTPQGKIIADFFVHRLGEDFFVLETAEKFGQILALRLKMYKLRAKIDIEDVSNDYDVYGLWDGTGDVGIHDPRHSKLGQRFLATSGSLTPEHSPEDYDLHRMSLSIPDSTWDFGTEQMFPADANMDLLNGVDYKKGCFIGQEVVSRMHRKTEVRKRMRAVELSGPVQSGDPLKAGGRTVGTLLHVRGDMATALVRLDRLAKAGDIVAVNDNPVTIMDS
ncbi:MAG: folate-binding protein YgfZ [Robiginitomaculum sp.]|nr:MAG: folate-binding protein YgfZ [Robiginitomaculum sp.]